MSKSLLIACFMAFITVVSGQSKPDKTDVFANYQIETYYFKKTTYDSVRFKIQGQNDTVLSEVFWRNGQYKIKKWRYDSIYLFSNQGFIEEKKFRLNLDEQADSVIGFHLNGQIKSIVAQEKDAYFRSKEMSENGVLVRQKHAHRVGQYGWYAVESDSFNRVFYASFSDTLLVNSEEIVWRYDTFFHRNGRPHLIQIDNSKSGIVKRHYFDENGHLIEAITPDSLRLKAFKDNVDCYYGLKKSDGTVVYKPRFDRIETLDDNLIAVHEGKKIRLMRTDGTFLATPDMESIEAFSNYFFLDNSDDWKVWQRADKLVKTGSLVDYFKFKIGKNQGVIDRNGRLIVPPQYRDLQRYYPSVDLFDFKVRDTAYHSVEEGYIDRTGASIFPNYVNARRYGRRSETEGNYFSVSNDAGSFNHEEKNVFGLINRRRELLLPCKFETIFPIENTSLFKVYLKEGDKGTEIRGIFDAQKRCWLVDTSRNLSIEYGAYANNFIVLYASKTEKYGIIDLNGKQILPMIYDTLDVVSEQKKLFIARKEKAYQLLSLSHKKPSKSYQFLAHVPFKVDFNHYVQEEDKPFMSPIFLAKLNGKWGLIDSNERVLRPFTSNYAGFSKNKLLLVDSNQVHYFSDESYLNQADFDDFGFSNAQKLAHWYLADNSDKLFFFNAKGRVVIPPQYHSVLGYDRGYKDRVEGYILVDDEQKKRKLLSTETGVVVDFSPDYRLKIASPHCKIIVIEDVKLARTYPYTSQALGVMTDEGRLITPCVNAGISVADGKIGSYFVRKDTPTVDFWKYAHDGIYGNLGLSDSDWFLYNAQGTLLDKTPFRFPIRFNNGLGIGVQGETYGIFRPDGSVLAPPQYKNIRQDEKTGVFYLFDNQGLTTTVSLKKADGTTFVEGGRYDGVSLFYGKYALARSAGRVGLIDTFGHEIIAPQDLLTFTKGNLMDSIALSPKELEAETAGLDWENTRFSWGKYRVPVIDFRYNKLSPDSLNLSPTLRNTLWHLILEKTHGQMMWQSHTVNVQRGQSNIGMYYMMYRSCGTGILSEEEKLAHTGRYALASDKTLSFALNKYGYGYYTPSFYNFYYKNNRWNELTINDLLSIEGEKQVQLNDLLIQKVKALKDVEIDCSNTANFVGQVKNQFMLTKEGINFHFNQNDKAIVSFTWAELQPFLKMRL
jgi:hypothetical protein